VDTQNIVNNNPEKAAGQFWANYRASQVEEDKVWRELKKRIITKLHPKMDEYNINSNS